ncbi:MAG: hypothetical protein Q4D51_13520 [Eubacteriales bacterium]|nr:hypothetical protein [Eubacteriales bacterium]
MKFSYKNVYGTPEYEKFCSKKDYVLDEKYLSDTEIEDLEDGYTVEVTVHDHREDCNGMLVMNADKAKCVLKKDGEKIYEYIRQTNSTFHMFSPFCHQDGHVYYPFHIDLYGISYLNLDTAEVYHYVPEGYETQYQIPCGESFIVTGVNYDKETNLVVYDGCYWAGCYELYVGDLTSPLAFNPHLACIRDMLQEREACDFYDVYFVKWDENQIVVKAENDEGTREYTVSFEEIRKEIARIEKEGK